MTDAPNIPRLDDLPFDLARQAYLNTSFHPDERARSDQKAYVDDVKVFHAEMSKVAATDSQKALLAEEIERYRQDYLKYFKAYLASHASIASPMITGRAGFPVAQMEKRNRWTDNKLTDFLEWRSKARAAIMKHLLDTRPQEEKDAAQWNALARDINGSLNMIQAIDSKHSPFTRSAFVNSIAGKVERLAMNGETALVDKALELVRPYNGHHDKPAITRRHKFWTFADLARQKAVQHDAELEQAPATIAAAEGIDIINNHQLDRVQIVFAAKPSVEIIGKLKAEGWHWSRTERAWQRKLTEAAQASAKRITALGWNN